MFSEKKEKNNAVLGASGQNIISKTTTITGDFKSDSDIRIEGTIDGNVETSKKVVIAKTGLVTGTLTAKEAYVEGKFSGKLELSELLTLKSSAVVEGDVQIAKLAVEPGATFNVNCVMKGGVKSLTNAKQKTEKSA